MATVRKWSNVAVAMQSALATALTITAITKASVGVVSYTGTDPTNGDYVLMTVQGMYQVTDRVFRVANVNAGSNTLELEGENTTLYETFVSGTAEVITFGTSITTMATVTGSGGDFDKIDTSTIHQSIKTNIPGSANPIEYSSDHLWDNSDAGQAAMRLASNAASPRCFKFTFGSGGPVMVFKGYVGFVGIPTGTAQDKVVSPSTFTMNGFPTQYTS